MTKAEKLRKYAGDHKKALRELVNRAKAKPCADCKVQYNPWVMDLDHRNPEDKFDTVANLVTNNKSFDVVNNEVAKCDVVCSNCHRERTHRQRLSGEI